MKNNPMVMLSNICKFAKYEKHPDGNAPQYMQMCKICITPRCSAIYAIVQNMQNTSMVMLSDICNCAKYEKHPDSDAQQNMQLCKI